MSQPERESLRRKRISRIAAVQGVYNRIVSELPVTPLKLQEQLTSQWRDALKDEDAEFPGSDMPEQALLGDVLTGTLEQRAELMELLAPTIKSEWKPERMDPVMRAILLCAAFELQFRPDRKTPMLVDEYVTIAGGFLDAQEQAYVNSAIRQLVTITRPAPAAGSHG